MACQWKEGVLCLLVVSSLLSWVLMSLGCCMLWECRVPCRLLKPAADPAWVRHTSLCLDWGLQLCTLGHRRHYFFLKKKLLPVHTLTPAQGLTLELSDFSFPFGILFSRHVPIQTFGMTASQETDVASTSFRCHLL